MDPDNSEVRA